MLTAREAGRKSVRKKNQSWVPTEYVEKSGWGPMNITMAQVYRGRSRECIDEVDFGEVCKRNTESNSKAKEKRKSTVQ